MSLLENRKLQISSGGPSPAPVFVIQDGSASSSATTNAQWDDGFRKGCDPAAGNTSPAGPDADKFFVTLDTLSNNYDTGHRLSFTIRGRHSWWSVNDFGGFRTMPGDKVELWADRGDQATTMLGSMPSWTLHAQSTGQVRYFHGWIDSVEPTSKGEIKVDCHSGLIEGNKVRMDRSAQDSLTIPKIAFNVDDPASPEFHYSVKIRNSAGVGALNKFGTGIPKDPTAYLMTLEEILQYLEARFGTALTTAEVTASSAIWVTSDLAKLTMKPQMMVMEDVGFVSCVKQLMRWAPNCRLMYDPRNLKFRIQEVADGFTSTSTTLSVGSAAGATTLNVANPALFSATPGADGNRGMVGGYANIEEFAVSSIDGSALTISSAMLNVHPTSSVVQPLEGTTLATATASYDSNVVGDSLNMRVDLDDVYTSCRIQSIHQKTGSFNATYDPAGASSSGGGLAKSWDTAFETSWRPGDENRNADFGVGGLGIPVYTTDTGGAGGKVRVYISYTDSDFREDHVNNEWIGSSLFVLTANGANTRNSGYTFAITDNTHSDDIGNGEKGMIVEINTTDLDAAVGGTFITDVEGTPDRIALTDDFQFSTTTLQNARSVVGRRWHFTDNVLSTIGGTESPHITTCNLPKVYVSDGSSNGARQLPLAPTQGYPAANTGPASGWLPSAPGALSGGHFQVFHQSFVTQAPAYDKTTVPCGEGGPTPGYIVPGAMNANVEYTTTTIREARFPASGEAGVAATYYNLSRTKEISSENWIRNDQDDHYEDLAERLWKVFANPNYTGSVSFIGTKEWAWEIDLCHRIAFSTQMGVVGGGDILRKFWGIANSVTVNLTTDRVDISFENRSPLADLAFEVLEDWGIDHKARLKSLYAQVKAMATLPACLSGSMHVPQLTAPGSVCSNAVSVFNRNQTVINLNMKPKQQALGLGETSIAVEEPLTGAKLGAYTTHGLRASASVERDVAGSHWLVSQQGIFPITLAGGGVTGTPVTNSASHNPLTIPGENANALVNMMAMLSGLTPLVSTPPAYTYVASSATPSATTFTIGHTALSSAIGGEIHLLDYDADNPRPAYTITGHSAAVITVAAISQALPANGTSAVIYYKPAPTLSGPDFPSGGLAFTDSGGNYLVYNTATGTLEAASRTGNVLGSAAGSSNARTVQFGAALNANIAADWSSNATAGFFKGERTFMASNSGSAGASQVGIQDSAGIISATTVEGALAELAAASGGLTTEQVQDIVGGMVTGNTETNIAVTYEDGDGTLDFVAVDTDTQLSTEAVQDIVGGMFSGNTETRIAVTYQDGDGTIDLAVDDMTADTQLTTEAVQDIVGAMVTGNTETNIAVTYQDGDGTLDFAAVDTDTNTQLTQEQVEDYVGGMLDGDETFITVAYDDTDGNIDFTVPVKDEDAMGSDSATHLATQQSIKAYVDGQTHAAALTAEQVQDIVGGMFTSNTETRVAVTYDDGDGTIDVVVDDMTADTQLTTEQVQDIVGGMFTGNTETRVAATYEDGDGTIDLVVDDMTADTQPLTTEQVQDIVGGMVTGNTETNIAVTYQDGDGTLDFVSVDTDTNTQLSQEQVEDYVGGMLDGDETFITVAYDDTDGNIDFTVPVKDEDAMGSNSATHLSTQQSIKAYVDSKSPSLVWEHFISWHGNTAAFTSGGAIGGKNASVHDSSDHDEHVVIYNFTTGNHRGMAWNWCVPGDLDVSAVVSAKIYFRLSGTPSEGAGTVYWGIEANAVADNESTATGGTKFSDTGTLDLSLAPYASGDLVVMDMGTQFGASSLAVGDYVRGVVWRDGTHASDNFGSTCQHIGIRFIGTKATA